MGVTFEWKWVEERDLTTERQWKVVVTASGNQSVEDSVFVIGTSCKHKHHSP